VTKRKCLALLSLFFGASMALAYEAGSDMPKQSDEVPAQLEGLKVIERPGQQLTLSREFVNEKGETVSLGSFYDSQRPVLLSIVYYGCPGLCNYHLNGLMETFKGMDQHIGSDFQVVVVSMDHRETSDLASKKKESYLKVLDQPAAAAGFHFLVGSEENVKALAEELGFPFRWDEAEQQYAHPAVAHITTPTGIISRYLHGIQFDSKTLRLSLVEAADGKIGNIVEQLTLFCFQFNPAKNKYTFFAFNVMRAGAGLTVVLLAIFLIPIWRRERRRSLAIAKGEA
jgi:protein SCO1/2